jgi:hypothetical protein
MIGDKAGRSIRRSSHTIYRTLEVRGVLPSVELLSLFSGQPSWLPQLPSLVYGRIDRRRGASVLSESTFTFLLLCSSMAM